MILQRTFYLFGLGLYLVSILASESRAPAFIVAGALLFVAGAIVGRRR